MWVCQESGGCPPCKRVCNTAFALTPAPPATVELTTSTPGLASVKASKSACNALDSPGEVHQEKISSASSACAAAIREPSGPRPTAPIPSAAPPLRTPRRDARDVIALTVSDTGHSSCRENLAVRHRTTDMSSDRKRSPGMDGQPAGASPLAARPAPCNGFVHGRYRTVN